MSGNGVDLASIHGAIVAISADLEAVRSEMATRGKAAGLRRDAAELRAGMAAYHGSAMGRGVLTSELDDRLRRLGQHPGLPPAA